MRHYRRAGALNLLAAFDTRSGKVYGAIFQRKRQVEFIAFLKQLERDISADTITIHRVLDNLKVHSGKLVQAWLAQHHTAVPASGYLQTGSAWCAA